MTPSEAQHAHLINVDSAYRWLSFRRALLSTTEYQNAVAIGLTSPNVTLAITLLASAIDACCSYGAEPDEVMAFLSAIDLLKLQLPSPDGDPIRSRLDALILEFQL
ncbi:hypothetical protein H6F48_09660 [Limnothrix sp. FACHB-1088]|nr:hypothetical protein [Limnothrix sp. FACHB-1088]